MSWRDQISDEGSFRGVRFLASEHELKGGRRLVQHIYPGKDRTYAEDQGREARDFSISVFVVGENYVAERDALIDAFEEPGPGTLRHPWLGTLRVGVQTYRLRETTRKGGMAEFTLTLIPAGANTFPRGRVDTGQAVNDQADAAIATAEDVFAEEYSAGGLPSWSVQGLEDRLQDLAGEIRGQASDLVELVDQPRQLAGAIAGFVGGLYDTAESTIAGLERATSFGYLWDTLPFTTPVRRQQAQSQHQLKEASRVAGVAEGCRNVATALDNGGIASQDRAFAALEAANQAIDEVQTITRPDGSPIDDRTYTELQQLRAAVNEDVRQRGLRLPEVQTWTPGQTMPALVIAHQIYGDARRDADIVARNDIRHPGFVPGGEPLELLRDE